MLILKGFIIGIGKIIPGVSGAMIAMSLGVYEKSLLAISNIHKDFINNFLYLFKLGVGVLLSIILGSKAIVYLLNNHYLLIMLLFVGLIIGGFKSVKKEITKLNKVFFTISILIVYLLTGVVNQNIVSSSNNIMFNLLLGFVDALTMVIPGISGTAVMMILGIYDKYINLLSNINLNIIFFLISLGISILMLSKFISYLFIKYKNITYSMVLGFSISSVIYLIITVIQKTNSIIELVIGIILFIIGFLISSKYFIR